MTQTETYTKQRQRGNTRTFNCLIYRQHGNWREIRHNLRSTNSPASQQLQHLGPTNHSSQSL